MSNKYHIDNIKMNILKEYKEKGIIVSYKDICNDFGWKIDKKGSNIKKAQFKTLDCMCKYIKIGNSKGTKYKIVEVFEKPKKKNDGRIKDGYNDNLVMDLEFAKNNSGVYAIVLENDIYIGSTINSFKERYNASIVNPNSEKHRDLIRKGGKFIRLWVAEKGFDDEDTIRKIEQLYLDYYMNNKDYNVVNGKRTTHTLYKKYKKENKNSKYKTIKVNHEDYEKVLKLLKERNIDVIEW